MADDSPRPSRRPRTPQPEASQLPPEPDADPNVSDDAVAGVSDSTTVDIQEPTASNPEAVDPIPGAGQESAQPERVTAEPKGGSLVDLLRFERRSGNRRR